MLSIYRVMNLVFKDIVDSPEEDYVWQNQMKKNSGDFLYYFLLNKTHYIIEK